MAPFTISPHHSLSYQCHLPQTAPYQQSKMSLELNPSGTPKDLLLNAYRRMSVFSMLLKIRLRLWQVIQNCLMSLTELFSSNMFLSICVGKNTAMVGELKKIVVVGGQERPGEEFMSGMLRSIQLDEEINDSEMELDDEELSAPAEWSIDDSEEEEDEGQLSEWESEEEDDDDDDDDDEVEEEDDEDNEEQPSHEETECDVDSEWSDDDDDEDSEASTESLELWESFFKSSDPFNPLSVSSCTTSSTNKNQLTRSSEIKQTKPATNEEEHYLNPSTKKGKKVCFNEKVTVSPLVAWSFASRAARDGSCWMRMARDRERFRRRVESVKDIITPCLTSAHRAGVWERLQRKTLS